MNELDFEKLITFLSANFNLCRGKKNAVDMKSLVVGLRSHDYDVSEKEVKQAIHEIIRRGLLKCLIVEHGKVFIATEEAQVRDYISRLQYGCKYYSQVAERLEESAKALSKQADEHFTSHDVQLELFDS